ncbi:MAG: nuclear transport factor 2 family protein [Myxococcota bacterium]|jgi:3-phenylpropionate/cinnamic acid dioxygenase small subunit|nr:nuclear transport factor 2 family protein [bacterium]MDP6074501.1 nuclear transport factor 2 family protein [Myxococcota bacterium]MCP4905975.1 nuclear transport factor 2 family protein [bacterium]MDP6241747.1 nuclear transport factor 2 family protein [Myxococcota bacterium]MDP7073886.1 nuclear transport factor 2 family protein [Myxococcota bacterium]
MQLAGSGADNREIVQVLDRYAEALDTRCWGLLSAVFVQELEFDFGEWIVSSREEAVATIRSYLDSCGPTQHLLGNYRIDIDGDAARSRVYVRAFHVGVGAAAGKTYEMGGEYRDELRRTPEGWRIHRREGAVFWEVGSRDVLGPAGS